MCWELLLGNVASHRLLGAYGITAAAKLPAPCVPLPAAATQTPRRRGTRREGRRGAETLLCVLSVLDGVLSQTQAVEEGTLDELLGDVNLLINRHPFVQVLAAACGCLTTLAARDTAGARALATTAASFAGWLRDPASARAEGRPSCWSASCSSWGSCAAAAQGTWRHRPRHRRPAPGHG